MRVVAMVYLQRTKQRAKFGIGFGLSLVGERERVAAAPQRRILCAHGAEQLAHKATRRIAGQAPQRHGAHELAKKNRKCNEFMC